MTRSVARVGDHTDGDGGQRVITSTGAIPKTILVQGHQIAVEGQYTKASGHDWESLDRGVFAARCTARGRRVAVVGSIDSGNHTVIEGASRVRVG